MTREEAISKLNELIECTVDRGMIDEICYEVIEFLEAKEPRVMTLEELKEYISLPPVFVDDLGEQEDYIQDIAPLYMDFPNPDPCDVHWRDVYRLRQNVNGAEHSYGKRWRVWTAKPTKEQREAVKWK